MGSALWISKELTEAARVLTGIEEGKETLFRFSNTQLAPSTVGENIMDPTWISSVVPSSIQPSLCPIEFTSLDFIQLVLWCPGPQVTF